MIKKTSYSILKEMRNQHLDSHYKLAVDDNKKTFEKNFYQLADAIAVENFPEIKQYDLGFQLVDKSKDNTKAFGIRAYRLKTLVFIPFFYDNGEVHGYELLFLPVQNIFLPNTSTWLVYLTSKESLGKGDNEAKLKGLFGSEYPNLLPLRRPIAMKAAKYMIKAALDYSDYQKILPQAIKESSLLSKAFLVTLDKFPFLVDKVNKFYGIGIVKEAINKVKNEPYVHKFLRKVATPPVRFYTTLDDTTNLQKEEVEKLFKQGYYIKDSREEREISRVVPKITGISTTTITSPGIYDLLTPGGKVETRPVLRAMIGKERGPTVVGVPRDNYKYFVIDEDKKARILEGSPTALGKHPDNKWVDFWNKAKKLSADELGERFKPKENDRVITDYVIFDKYGNGIVIDWDLKYNGVILKKNNSDKLSYSKPQSHTRFPYTDDILKVYVPDKVGLVELGTGSYILGDILRFDGDLQKEARYLKIYFDRGSFILNKQRFEKIGALKELVVNWGLREKTALNLLKEAEDVKCTRYYVKQAAAYDIMQSEQPVPYFPSTPWTEFAPGYQGTTEYAAEQWVPGLKRPQPVYNIMEPPPKNVIDTLNRLSDVNNGDVFDLNLISGLLYSVRGYNAVEKNLPKIISGLDGMGRILFSMYRYKDKMVDHFGEEDYNKIVDMLRTNIESVGDMAMDLAQQEIDPYLKGMSVETEQLREETI